jgi:hypothetical protein
MPELAYAKLALEDEPGERARCPADGFSARDSPANGSLWGTRLGLGARWRVGRLRGRVELAPPLILSDYGTTEYSPGTFWAAAAGVPF